MSDEFEDSRIFLELYYFTVSLITENLNPIKYFKSDFVVLIQPIIEKFVAQFPGQSERQIMSNNAYKTLVQVYVQKMRPIIDTTKQSGLWIPQGGSPTNIDATELIGQVLSSEAADVEQILILRSVKINNLLYSPELTLYYNACLMCCQSPIVIVRLYSYSLLRSAPVIVDLRHLFNVFKVAMDFWQRGPVSFEFCAALFLLLERLSEHRPSPIDANEFNLILSLIENINNSQNFETLMCFDTSLKWMYKLFTQEMLNNVIKNSIEYLKQSHSGDFCIICHCLSVGIGDPSQFLDIVAAALRTVACWAHPIQREARASLAALPLHHSTAISDGIIDIIASVLEQPPQISEPTLFIFAEFLSSYYLGTSAPLKMNLLKSLLGIMKQNEGKRNLPHDIRNIIVAICSNPVRLLEVLSNINESRTIIINIISGVDKWSNSLMTTLAAFPSYVITSESDAKSAAKNLREKMLSIEDKENNFYNVRLHKDLPLLVSIYPGEIRKLVENLNETFDEDFKYIVIELFTIVTLQGRIASECRDLLQLLPKTNYESDYSNLVKTIEETLKRPKSVFEELSSHIDDGLSQFLVVGSASHTAASLLFEHVVWQENSDSLVVCKRLQLRPASWFASALASLFSSIVKEPTQGLTKLIDSAAKSPERLVWIGYIIFNRIIPLLKEILTNETFYLLPKYSLYPQLEFEPTQEELNKIEEMQTKYKPALQSLFDVIVGIPKR